MNHSLHERMRGSAKRNCLDFRQPMHLSIVMSCRLWLILFSLQCDCGGGGGGAGGAELYFMSLDLNTKEKHSALKSS